jgi:hypothetical protein
MPLSPKTYERSTGVLRARYVRLNSGAEPRSAAPSAVAASGTPTASRSPVAVVQGDQRGERESAKQPQPEGDDATPCIPGEELTETHLWEAAKNTPAEPWNGRNGSLLRKNRRLVSDQPYVQRRDTSMRLHLLWADAARGSRALCCGGGRSFRPPTSKLRPLSFRAPRRPRAGRPSRVTCREPQRLRRRQRGRFSSASVNFPRGSGVVPVQA